MKKTTTRIVVPKFATEAEEAEWWYKNRNLHGKQLLAAVKDGQVQVLTNEKLRERIAASKKTPAPVVSLRIPEADLALARKQAEQKGLPYQTYIKSLLHEHSLNEKSESCGDRPALERSERFLTSLHRGSARAQIQIDGHETGASESDLIAIVG